MSQADLEKVDLAVVNLLCAQGLPGAESLDVKHAVATLDRWADVVTSETERHLYRVHDPQFAKEYRHSEAYLRAVFLVQVLYEDLGVKYNPALAGSTTFDFKDSRVAFIHGMIPGPGQSMADTPGGTCASMPVMIVAVGRRLGYPLRLVTTKGHIFVRWNGRGHPDPAWRERFNIEVTHGFSSYDDDYYRSWPAKLTDADIRDNHYLASLTPAEELAEFLAARGHCNLDNGQVGLAAWCYENAYRYNPKKPDYQDWFVEAAMKSNYRPETPALAQLLHERSRPRFIRRPMIDPGVPRPGETFPMVQTPGAPQPQVPGELQIPSAAQSHVQQVPQPGIPQPYRPLNP